MFVITTNFDEVLYSINARLNAIDSNRICLMMAEKVRGSMRTRIHEEGKAADGSPIGTYSEGYMKVRTGDFGNRKKITKGKNKGQANEKDAGLFVRGKNKGQPRPLYNRDNDTKVVASLTRQMENALTVIPLANGAGIGFHDDLNYNKSKWVEETYGKDIFALTDQERAEALEIAQREVDRILSQ